MNQQVVAKQVIKVSAEKRGINWNEHVAMMSAREEVSSRQLPVSYQSP
jgi:hypothetical protein